MSETDGYAILRQTIIKDLIRAGPNIPKTLEEFDQFVKKWQRVISVSDVLDIFSAYQLLGGEETSVVVKELKPLILHINKIDAFSWNEAVRISLHTNTNLIYAAPNSPEFCFLKKSFKKDINENKIHKGGQKDAMLSMAKNAYMHKTMCVSEIMDIIIRNLSEINYIKIIEHKKIKYCLPTNFMFLWIERIMVEYKNYHNRMMGEGSPPQSNFLPRLINKVNMKLTEMKNCIASNANISAKVIEAGVSSLIKDKQMSLSDDELSDSKIGEKMDSDVLDIPTEKLAYETETSSADFMENFDVVNFDDSRDAIYRDNYHEGTTTNTVRHRSMETHVDKDTVRNRQRQPRPTDDIEDNLEDYLNCICEKIVNLTVDDISDIPSTLLAETIPAILMLEKMGENKPKTVERLCNSLKPLCRYTYFASIKWLTSNNLRRDDVDQPCLETKQNKRGKRKFITSETIHAGQTLKYSLAVFTPQHFFTTKDIDKNDEISHKENKYQHKWNKWEDKNCAYGERTPLGEVVVEASAFYAQFFETVTRIAKQESSCIVMADKETKRMHFEKIKLWLENVHQMNVTLDVSKVAEELDDSRHDNGNNTEDKKMREVKFKVDEVKTYTRGGIYHKIIESCYSLNELSAEYILRILDPYVKIDEKEHSMKYSFLERKVVPDDVEKSAENMILIIQKGYRKHMHHFIPPFKITQAKTEKRHISLQQKFHRKPSKRHKKQRRSRFSNN